MNNENDIGIQINNDNQPSNNNDNADIVSRLIPRKDITEPAFRRYEELIARALNECFEYHPSKMNLKPSTFIARFRDALTGVRRFKYSSSLFDVTKDDIMYLLSKVRVDLLKGLDNVYIHNAIVIERDKVAKALNLHLPSSNPQLARVYYTELMTKISSREITNLPYLISYPTTIDRDQILYLCRDILQQNPSIDCLVSDYGGKINLYRV